MDISNWWLRERHAWARENSHGPPPVVAIEITQVKTSASDRSSSPLPAPR